MTNSDTLTKSHLHKNSLGKGETILKVRGASKKFAITTDYALRYGTSRILRLLFGIKENTSELRPGEVWALKNVSFDLRRGETLGIIGSNGAGKSTLLKMINGVFMPDMGSIAVQGTVGGLIEIGAGFQPKLTGRENIYVIAAVLGFSRDQVNELMDDIIDFADIGDFIDAPVQSYSSGMQVRLGFAIHVFQKPDLLLADEVLAVGDFEFQQKCLAKINEIRKHIGMILVSHSMPTMARFCNRALVLERGTVLYDGDPGEAVTIFTSRRTQLMSINRKKQIGTDDSIGGTDSPECKQETEIVCLSSGKRLPKRIFGPEFMNVEKISEVQWDWISTKGSGSKVVTVFDRLVLMISFRMLAKPKRLVIGVPIFTSDGTMLTAFNTDVLGLTIPDSVDRKIQATLVVNRLSINPGEYVACLAIQDGWEYIYRQVIDTLVVVPALATNGGHSIYLGSYSEAYSWSFEEL